MTRPILSVCPERCTICGTGVCKYLIVIDLLLNSDFFIVMYSSLLCILSNICLNEGVAFRLIYTSIVYIVLFDM